MSAAGTKHINLEPQCGSNIFTRARILYAMRRTIALCAHGMRMIYPLPTLLLRTLRSTQLTLARKVGINVNAARIGMQNKVGTVREQCALARVHGALVDTHCSPVMFADRIVKTKKCSSERNCSSEL